MNDCPKFAAVAISPQDKAHERHHFDNSTNYARGAYYRGEPA
jgi:hypothetical protein